MKNKLNIAEQLKQKYHKCEEVTNFKEMIERSAQIYKTRTAFKLKNKDGEIYSKTYEEVKNDIYALGTELIENGLTNKRIAVIGKNSYKWAISYLASSIVGVVVPIDKELHSDDVINFMNVAECECILGDGKNLKTITENIEKLNNKKTIFVDFEKSFEHYLEAGRTLLEKENTKFEEIKINPDEMKILLFTSGTTGNAKGVCLSQKNICSNILSIYGIVKVKKSDLFFSILPLHHTYECTIGFLLPLYSGASICYCDGLRYISKNMLEYHPSVILCVPLLLESMYKKIMKSLKKSLPEKYTKDGENPIDKLPFILRKIVSRKVKNTLGGRLRVFIVGAAAVNPEIANTFDKLKLNSLQGYGLTECAPLVAGNTDFFKRNDSAGLPIPTVEYKIDNPNQEGVGEIIVKGPNVMLGYYNMPEETEKVLKDGWFHTGDLGKIDENGFLYITGRCKSVIVTKNGKNIYPEEIESYLNESPLISESLVIGTHKENDDETYVNAQIFPNKEAITEYLKGTVPTKEEIKKVISDVIANVNSKIPNYKHIKDFAIRDSEFEKTTTQKVKRYGNNMKIDK
ncbi:MAG: AMP-dependent synthetase/ligase [Clostridia bacterium]